MNLRFFLALVLGLLMTACGPEVEPDHNDTGSPETENPVDPEKPEDPGSQDPEPEPKPEPEPVESYYVEVAENFSDWTGDYLITYTTSSTVSVFDSFSDTSKGASETDLISHLTAEGIHSDYGDPYKAVVSKVGEGYSVYLTGVGYLGMTASKNSVSKTDSAPTASTDEYLWTFSYKSGGSVWMSNVGHSGYRLQWNNSASCFRCYNGSQEELTLYRRGTSTGGATPSPDPDPDTPVTPDPEPDPNPDPEPEPDPDPDQPGDIPTPVPGQSGKYGWYELPVIDYSSSGSYLIDNNDKNLYYAHHMCAGNEKGPGGKKARNYTVCYSAEHHCPVWVAAPRHKMYQSGASRTDAYGKDPAIPSNIQYSSKSTGGGCNKGHMLGSAERLSSTATNKQVFYYTNIAPQYSDTFNTGGGGWNILEDWVDTQVCSDTLYVVIGTYFETYTDKRGNTDSPKTISFGGRSDVTRPSMFYYVLLRTKSGSSGKPLSQCSTSEIKCAAFVRSHKTPKKTAVSSMDMMSVSDLEKITGFTYFPNVPQAPKNSYKASDWGL
ncbi:MAG: DNA/RNA non-specific endonuclease [Bacteroidales bacterium]|nr:DNA/RNA non-specific endonuclease [Bacteroidales bacterium]